MTRPFRVRFMAWLIKTFKLRTNLYKLGFRPKPGSIFYSPSLSFIYGWRDSNADAKLVKALEDGRIAANNALKEMNARMNSEEIPIRDIPNHVHLPQQHRDGKPPWCNVCGLTKGLQVPKSVFDRGDKPTIHQEPDCVDNEFCTYPEPHRHGFACDNTCRECHGKCHKDCPAHDEYYSINPGMPKS